MEEKKNSTMFISPTRTLPPGELFWQSFRSSFIVQMKKG
jgi:hypothetical protein